MKNERRRYRVTLIVEATTDPSTWDFDTLMGEPVWPEDEPDDITVESCERID